MGGLYPENITELKRTTDQIEWPNGASLAVLVSLDYQAEVGSPTLPDGQPHYQELSERSYGGRCGVTRILDIFEKHGVKASFCICGKTAELYPETALRIARDGHELGGHGYDHVNPTDFTGEQEEADIQKTISAIKTVTGHTIRGWRSPKVRISGRTLPLLMKYGFTWNSDLLNDDLPYYLADDKNQRLLEIPYTWSTNDARIIGFPHVPTYGIPADQLSIWKDEFDTLYSESQKRPKLFAFNLHPFISGRPSRARALDQFMDYMTKHKGLWFAKGSEIVEWWKSRGY